MVKMQDVRGIDVVGEQVARNIYGREIAITALVDQFVTAINDMPKQIVTHLTFLYSYPRGYVCSSPEILAWHYPAILHYLVAFVMSMTDAEMSLISQEFHVCNGILSLRKIVATSSAWAGLKDEA